MVAKIDSLVNDALESLSTVAESLITYHEGLYTLSNTTIVLNVAQLSSLLEKLPSVKYMAGKQNRTKYTFSIIPTVDGLTVEIVNKSLSSKGSAQNGISNTVKEFCGADKKTQVYRIARMKNANYQCIKPKGSTSIIIYVTPVFNKTDEYGVTMPEYGPRTVHKAYSQDNPEGLQKDMLYLGDGNLKAWHKR